MTNKEIQHKVAALAYEVTTSNPQAAAILLTLAGVVTIPPMLDELAVTMRAETEKFLRELESRQNFNHRQN